MSEPAPHDRPFPPGAFEPYKPAVIPPDPARDARVAARRAADARRAGAALDRLLADTGESLTPWQRDVIEQLFTHGMPRLHHNRHYGVPADGHLDLRTCCSTLKTHAHGEWCRNATDDAWADAWPERCGSNLGPLRGTCDLQAGHDGPC